MRIAIEALGIDHFGGGRSATLTLLETVFSLDTENQYLILLSAPEPSLRTKAGNVHQWVAPIRNRFAVRLWAQLLLPFRLRKYHVVHFMKNLLVWGIPAPIILTIHDLTPLLHPELFPSVDVWYWRHLQKLALRSADLIIAVSGDTARDLVRFYALPPDRIHVVHNACAPRFEVIGREEIDRVRARYELPERYILHVGRIDRKKNLSVLVEAFAELRRSAAFDGQLVLVGEEYHKSMDSNLMPTIERLHLSGQVSILRRIPDADLPALYSGATVGAFPSHHEGFGLMALEAMACGAPLVVNRRAGAILEVVGDAALTLDPMTPGTLAEALARVIGHPALRMEMRQKGLAQAALFSRQNAARKTLDIYRSLMPSDG